MKKEFIIKETEKAIMVKGKFENIFLDVIKEKTFWIPKKCISEKGIELWFLKNKISELFNVDGVVFKGLVSINK